MQRIKCCIIGDPGVGKTSFIHSYMDKSIDNIKTTMGVDFFSKSLYIKDSHVRLTIWDTAGAERYQSLMHSYLRDSQIIVIAFDVSKKEISIVKYLHMVESYKAKVVCITGIKNDLTSFSHNLTDIIEPWKRNNWNILVSKCSTRQKSSVKLVMENAIKASIEQAPAREKKTPNFTIFIKRPHKTQKCCT
jgi:small GTP-binding protein